MHGVVFDVFVLQVAAPSAQRLLQQRKPVGIESHRRLQQRRFYGAGGGTFVDGGIVGNVAMRGGAAPALQHRADELHVVAGGDRGTVDMVASLRGN